MYEYIDMQSEIFQAFICYYDYDLHLYGNPKFKIRILVFGMYPKSESEEHF